MNDIIKNLKKSCISISKLMRETDPFILSKMTNNNNNSGDDVKSLDILANDILKKDLSECNDVKIIGSEEEEEFYYTKNETGCYLVCFDPLDGSSNIDSNITVGTIFAIYDIQKGLNNGDCIVCAGYCLYGSSTQFIVATNKIEIYLLRDKDFVLIEDNLKIKDKGNIYSVNESNKNKWIRDKDKLLINKLIDLKFSCRWVGSMVTDCHRTLIKGGIFAYPSNKKDIDGKIRILYEAYPFAYIFKIAGGKSSNGEKDILNIAFPKNIHQKTPVYLGSNYEMNILISL